MKRKILSLVTALALCLSLFPAPALAAEGDGTALTAQELAKNSTGPGTFTVACAHASVGTVTASNPQNGVVTVTAHCTDCDKDITLGTLTMGNDGLTITYGDEIPTFAVQAQVGHQVSVARQGASRKLPPGYTTFRRIARSPVPFLHGHLQRSGRRYR